MDRATAEPEQADLVANEKIAVATILGSLAVGAFRAEPEWTSVRLSSVRANADLRMSHGARTAVGGDAGRGDESVARFDISLLRRDPSTAGRLAPTATIGKDNGRA